MTELLLRGSQAEDLIAQRRRAGVDTYDEVWAGVYHVAPAGTGEHGALQAGLLVVLRKLQPPGLVGTGPVNLGTERDYRVPDAALLHDEHRREVWIPRALLVGEILSKDDQTYEKFGHYERHEVQEVVVVDPVGRRVEVWRRAAAGGYERATQSAVLAGRSAEQLWVEISA
ncbi:MAG TPA: Uma2 family endonuclease [Kineosporiaceae bacterium]|nr:Uma2 family endonuclease [Kineosporiaceae bacterium]